MFFSYSLFNVKDVVGSLICYLKILLQMIPVEVVADKVLYVQNDTLYIQE
jgi:hypothetical protein